MKISKWLFLIAALFIVNAASAQHAKGNRQNLSPEQRAEKRSLHMKQKLSLNDDQTKGIKEILITQEKDMAANRKAAREKFQKSDNDIRKMLNEDQQKKFDGMRKEQRKQMMEHRRQLKDHKQMKGGEVMPDENNNPPKNAPQEEK